MLQTKQSKLVPFTFVRKRIYYFNKRVPADLIHHYRYAMVRIFEEMEGLINK